MKGHVVSVAEGKKGFSRLIDEAVSEKEGVVVTKRGKPVAVILSYEEYLRTRRRNALQKIMETREIFLKAGISAEESAKEARKELESRG